MIGFREREIVEGAWSEAYYDLHDGCFSLCQKSLVVLHADSIWLSNVKFAVQPKGLEKVRETGVKNVHAYVRGNYRDHDLDLGADPIEYLLTMGYAMAYYNPKVTDTFIDFDTKKPLYEATSVILVNKRILYIY